MAVSLINSFGVFLQTFRMRGFKDLFRAASSLEGKSQAACKKLRPADEMRAM